ncbi:hypothetical protein PILCRDRAFT_830160 [Piloderma croceum F 1598]|uniref:DUF605-domain-containing protein n=1 Tax=Piloderma croceum (strain F 1598) TaxID=765440 RepID=A0A0C3AD92_PILCF|nr:hypothetical protein PILCRDRAFT_830160 [Piloderma croceum F 1598]
MSPSILGLPPVSPELKSIVPYLQRADELQVQDPLMAYWCAYYAAQIGISLKAKSTGARDLLFELLAVLEGMKQELGPSDAVNIESVSSAYVENFALKVFGMADNEDRKGEATRSTAKKFLAAANFLEVLKIFPKTPMSDSSEEKIRYSKWKAADIAKAFREGRKPTPGPAGSGTEPDYPEGSTSAGTPDGLSPPSFGAPLSFHGKAPVAGKQSPPSPPLSGKTSPKRMSPPPHMDSADIARANQAPREFQPKTPLRPGAGVTGEDVSSPGSWSTAATPGTDDRTKSGIDFEYEEQVTPTRVGTGGSKLKNAWVSAELETGSDGVDEDSVGINATSQKRTVRFTPSVIGGLTPPITPGESGPSRPFVPVQPELHLSPISQSPPSGNGHYQTSPTSSSTNSPPKRNRVTSFSTSPPHSAGVPFSPPAPSPPTHYQPSAPPLPYAAPVPMYASAPPPSPPPHPRVPSPVPDLTPQLIAKAQKHCRFAISALDYEDADQARKELRAALAVLGG